jgi:hypothetical protein
MTAETSHPSQESEPRTAPRTKIGDVVARGTVPCRVCKEPHVSRITQLATKHQGSMASWAADDGHAYVKMSAEEVVAILAIEEQAATEARRELLAKVRTVRPGDIDVATSVGFWRLRDYVQSLIEEGVTHED